MLFASALPGVDPIPLPAPVWLMKFLELLTLALHFVAVQLFLGGLIIATLWALYGQLSGNRTMRDAAGAIISRLPVVMTYVINLGVPPLLFTQVLYGRAIYSSSVVMGVYWISVVFILCLVYSCLYIMGKMAEKGGSWGWVGLIAIAGALKIAMIYTANMTLMLRPEAWLEMYRNNPLGAQLPSGDPTIMPRLVFMVVGGLVVAGIGMTLLGLQKNRAEETSAYLRQWGGRLAVLGILGQTAAAWWVFRAQPEIVRTELMAGSLYKLCVFAWLATAALVMVAALAAQAGRRANWLVCAGASLLAVLNIGAMVIVRDGIRDITLLQAGFDVWDREVASNWMVIIAFFVLFVIGLGVVGWLISLVAKAKQVKESYV